MEKKIIAALLILLAGCQKEEQIAPSSPPTQPFVWYDITGVWLEDVWTIKINIDKISIYPHNGGYGDWDTYIWTQQTNNAGFFRRRYLDTIFVEMLNDTQCIFTTKYPMDSVRKSILFKRR